MSAVRSRLRRVVLRLAMLGLGLTFAELTLWIAERSSPLATRVLRPVQFQFPADPRLGRRGNPDLPDHDARGWRNPQALERADVVALGDSQTYGDEVAREEAWPLLLARLGPRSVYNMGLSGYGPVEYERLLDEALALRPRVVLVGLYAGNDLADAYLAAYEGGRAPELRTTDAEQRARFASLDQEGPVFASWKEMRAAVAKPSVLPSAVDGTLRATRTYSLIRGVVKTAKGLARSGSEAPDSAKLWRKATQRTARSDVSILWAFEDGEVRTVFTPTARLAVLDTGDPRIEDGVRISLDALERMRERCAARCRVAVVAIPTKELAFAARVAESGAAPPAAYRALVEREAALWERLREELARRGIATIDALPALREVIASGEPAYQVDWNGHPTARGQRAIAEATLAQRAVWDESL